MRVRGQTDKIPAGRGYTVQCGSQTIKQAHEQNIF